MRALVLLLALLAAPLAAQTVRQPVEARTEDGRVFLIDPDGTWSLVEVTLDLDAVPAPPPPPAPPPSRQSVASSRQTLTSASGAYAIDYDPTVWSRPRSRSNEDAEFEVTRPFGAAYALAIYEAFPSTNKQVRDMVVANAELGTGYRVTILSERNVQVSGGSGIQIEMEGRAENGIEFVYIVSVFGTDQGALQITTFTSKSAVERERAAMLEFLDGIRLIKAGK